MQGCLRFNRVLKEVRHHRDGGKRRKGESVHCGVATHLSLLAHVADNVLVSRLEEADVGAHVSAPLEEGLSVALVPVK